MGYGAGGCGRSVGGRGLARAVAGVSPSGARPESRGSGVSGLAVSGLAVSALDLLQAMVPTDSAANTNAMVAFFMNVLLDDP
jgi:hypothetical protein